MFWLRVAANLLVAISCRSRQGRRELVLFLLVALVMMIMRMFEFDVESWG